jgi:hypothetical protein
MLLQVEYDLDSGSVDHRALGARFRKRSQFALPEKDIRGPGRLLVMADCPEPWYEWQPYESDVEGDQAAHDSLVWDEEYSGDYLRQNRDQDN